MGSTILDGAGGGDSAAPVAERLSAEAGAPFIIGFNIGELPLIWWQP